MLCVVRGVLCSLRPYFVQRAPGVRLAGMARLKAALLAKFAESGSQRCSMASVAGAPFEK
jgi:hypothetical protein